MLLRLHLQFGVDNVDTDDSVDVLQSISDSLDSTQSNLTASERDTFRRA